MTAAALPEGVRRIAAHRERETNGLLHKVFTMSQSLGPPAPQEYVIPDYIPEGWVTTLFAKAGSSKSYLALVISFHIALGLPIFGRPVNAGPVVFLDAELDRKTFESRCYAIARGLGINPLLDNLHYLNLTHSLTDPAYNADVLAVIDHIRPRLSVIDSFTAALRGRDTNSLDDVTERWLWLNRLGTCLLIDHVAKGAGIDGSATAIGSVAKQIFNRSQMFIASNGTASVLRLEKHQFGPPIPPLQFALNFTTDSDGRDEVRLEAPLPDDDSRIHGLEAALPAKDRTRRALQSGEWPDGATADELAEALELSPSTIRNALTTLKKENVAETDRGKWRLR